VLGAPERVFGVEEILGNTVLLCVLNVTGMVLSSALVAYGFARLEWRGRDHVFAALLATGISSMLAIQVLVNTAMVLGMMPVVGIPLPLLSYGGSSFLVTMLCLGLLLNIHMRRFMY